MVGAVAWALEVLALQVPGRRVHQPVLSLMWAVWVRPGQRLLSQLMLLNSVVVVAEEVQALHFPVLEVVHFGVVVAAVQAVITTQPRLL